MYQSPYVTDRKFTERAHTLQGLTTSATVMTFIDCQNERTTIKSLPPTQLPPEKEARK